MNSRNHFGSAEAVVCGAVTVMGENAHLWTHFDERFDFLYCQMDCGKQTRLSCFIEGMNQDSARTSECDTDARRGGQHSAIIYDCL